MADADNGGAANPPPPPPDSPKAADYLQTLYKLIPTEVTAGYLVLYSVLNPLGQVGEPTYNITVGFLFFAIAVLAVVNYFAFPIIRRITRRDIRVYVSATFLVWVLGTSVDFWISFLSGTFGLEVPSGIFLGVVILWAVASVLLLRESGLDELKR